MGSAETSKKPHTSAAVKNKYNSKAYDRIEIIVKKGEKDVIKARAAARGMSVSEYINALINADAEINT